MWVWVQFSCWLGDISINSTSPSKEILSNSLMTSLFFSLKKDSCFWLSERERVALAWWQLSNSLSEFIESTNYSTFFSDSRHVHHRFTVCRFLFSPGIQTVLNFAGDIFEDADVGLNSDIATIIVGIMQVVGSIGTGLLVDKVSLNLDQAGTRDRSSPSRISLGAENEPGGLMRLFRRAHTSKNSAKEISFVMIGGCCFTGFVCYLPTH